MQVILPLQSNVKHRMLPPISAIASIEMIRDGGSLQAEFIGANGSQYGIHLQLISEETPQGDWVRTGYKRPIVFEKLTIWQPDRLEWQAIHPVEISWEHAKVLLHQLRAFVQRDEDAQWLAAMETVVRTKGKIPLPS